MSSRAAPPAADLRPPPIEMDDAARRVMGGEVDRYLRGLEASEAFSGVVRVTVGEDERFAGAYGFATRAWHAEHPRHAVRHRLDHEAVHGGGHAAAGRRGRIRAGHGAIGYLGLEGTAIAPESPSATS